MIDAGHSAGLIAVAPPPVALGALVAGRAVSDVVALVPRVFNLCRGAQEVAVRMACGWPVGDVDLTAEVLRDHRLHLSVILPAKLGIAPGAPPAGTLDDMLAHPLVAQVAHRFPAGVGVVPGAAENSVAGRVADRPVMQAAEARFGRGPVWRVIARCVELAAPSLAAPTVVDGWAVVPAARGLYRLRADLDGGRVVALDRRTPTDDMLAPGGTAEATLATIIDPALAQLALDILDPCVPLTVREACDA